MDLAKDNIPGNGRNIKNVNDIFLTNSGEYEFLNIDLPNSQILNLDVESAIRELSLFCKTNDVNFSYSVSYISLLEEGALEVPLVFKANDLAYSVFFIYNEQDAKKYLDAKEKISETTYPNAIYFSSLDINQINEKLICTRTFKLSDLKFYDNAVIRGEYAMWWAGDFEDVFWNSETSRILQSTYKIFSEYETVHTGYLLQQIGLANELDRTELPEDEKVLPVIGPENKSLIIILSKEKGIQFLFPIKTTSKFFREQFLFAISIDFLTFRLSLQQQAIEKDQTNVNDSCNWFLQSLTEIAEQEKMGVRIEEFGGKEVLIY